MICAVLTGMAKPIFAFDMVTREQQCPIPVRPAGQVVPGTVHA